MHPHPNPLLLQGRGGIRYLFTLPYAVRNICQECLFNLKAIDMSFPPPSGHKLRRESRERSDLRHPKGLISELTAVSRFLWRQGVPRSDLWGSQGQTSYHPSPLPMGEGNSLSARFIGSYDVLTRIYFSDIIQSNNG
jgi:hypothetical protein